MAWTKDTASDPPRIIYTPGAGDEPLGLRRVIYDPSASADKRVTLEAAFVMASDETVTDLDTAWGITT